MGSPIEASNLAPVRYELNVRVDYESKRVEGTAMIRLRNRTDHPVDHMPLLLYRLMRVTSIRDAAGNPLEHTQQVQALEDWDRLQVNYVEARLKPALQPGAEMTVEVAWSGYLFGYVDAGMLYVQETIDPAFTILRPDALAYPKIGYPNWKVNRSAGLPEFDYELHVTVPDDLVVASGGALEGVSRSDGEATFSYASIRPSWRMDIAIAPYETLERDGLRVFHFADDAAGAATLADAFLRAVATFSEWFGPLPEFRGFTIIEIPSGFGSQTDVTCIHPDGRRVPRGDTTVRAVSRGLASVARAAHRPAGPALGGGPGGIPGTPSRRSLCRAEELVEVERAADEIRRGLIERFDQHPELAEIPMADFGRNKMTGYSYRVGMLMFGVLYHRVGPAGFDSIVGEYFRRYQASGGSTDDFAALATEIAGQDLRPLFQDWLYTTSYRRFLDTELSLSQIAKTYP